MNIDNDVYNRLASTWWDEDEIPYIMRALINPGRLDYMLTVLKEVQFDLKDKEVLDVGCGGGLLAEAVARLGCHVTGVDPSTESLAVARTHAAQAGLSITYQAGAGEHLPFADNTFDLVYCCGVLEHVNDLEAVISEIARVLKNNGIFFYDTFNRTWISKLIMINLLQEWKATSVLPPKLHDWKMFIKPRELQTLMRRHGLNHREVIGLIPSANPLTTITLIRKRKRGKLPMKELESHLRLVRSKNTSNVYIGYAVKA